MEQDVSSATHAAKGALRLGASRTPAVHLLPQVIYEFSKAYPGIRIDLSVRKTSSVLHDLQEGRIDAGIIEGTIIDKTIPAEAIAEDEIVIIAPENHPLTKKKNITLQELFTEPLILPDSGSGTRELIDAFIRNGGFGTRHLKVRMTIGSPELIVQMVQAGLGIAFASKWSVFAAVKGATVKLLRIPGKTMNRKIYIIGVDRKNASTAVNTFSEFVRGYRFFIPF